MATFFQWRYPVTEGRSPTVGRVTWLCGVERLLVEEALDYLVADLGRLCTLTRRDFTGGSDPEREVWAAANQYPLSPESKTLLVIRHADKLSNWAALDNWLADRTLGLANTYLVFISEAEDFPMVTSTDRKRTLLPHVQQIQKRGSIIKCVLPTGEHATATLIRWVLAQAPLMPSATARHLIERCGGELRDIRDVCAKLAVLPGTPGPGVIDELCPARAAQGFADALTCQDKPRALAALADLPAGEYSRTLGLLDSRLTSLVILQAQLRRGLSARDIAVERKVPQVMQQPRFREAAKHYDPRRVAKDRQALAVTDVALRSGARTGVLEALVVLW